MEDIKLVVGQSLVTLNEQYRVPAQVVSFRTYDGIPGKLQVVCKNGHTEIREVSAVLASMIVNFATIEHGCHTCGEKINAPPGYYVRNEKGTFERLGGVPDPGA